MMSNHRFCILTNNFIRFWLNHLNGLYFIWISRNVINSFNSQWILSNIVDLFMINS